MSLISNNLLIEIETVFPAFRIDRKQILALSQSIITVAGVSWHRTNQLGLGLYHIRGTGGNCCLNHWSGWRVSITAATTPGLTDVRILPTKMPSPRTHSEPGSSDMSMPAEWQGYTMLPPRVGCDRDTSNATVTMRTPLYSHLLLAVGSTLSLLEPPKTRSPADSSW